MKCTPGYRAWSNQSVDVFLEPIEFDIEEPWNIKHAMACDLKAQIMDATYTVTHAKIHQIRRFMDNNLNLLQFW